MQAGPKSRQAILDHPIGRCEVLENTCEMENTCEIDCHGSLSCPTPTCDMYLRMAMLQTMPVMKAYVVVSGDRSCCE